MSARILPTALLGLALSLGLPGGLAQPSSPARAAPAVAAPVLPRLEPGRLVGLRGGTVLWTLALPRSAYPLPQPVLGRGVVWVAWGPVLRRVSLERGQVEASLYLPARIATLEPDTTSGVDSGDGVALELDYGGGVRERFRASGQQLSGRPVYLPTLAVTGALEHLASSDLGFDPLRPETEPQAQARVRARLERDPLNPFLHLYLGRALQRAGQAAAALRAYQDALALEAPFFVSVRLARLLDGFGYAVLADEGLQAARQRWEEQGYSAELAVSAQALRSYGDPLGYAQGLGRAGSALRRDAWMRFLRDTLPRFEGHPEVYRAYAAQLGIEDREGEASEWRSFAQSLGRGTLYGLGPGALEGARQLMRLILAVLGLSLLLILLALKLRYLGPQRQALRSNGGLLAGWVRHPLRRLRHSSPAYHTFSEKLVLLSLLLGLGVVFGALSWAGRTEARATDPALGLGTYGGAWFYSRFERLNPDPLAPETALVLGLAAQLDGDTASAGLRFEAGGALAALENNAGALELERGNLPAAQARFRAALSLDPQLEAASQNLAQLSSGDPSDSPRLAYPSQTQLYRALDGVWSRDLERLLSNPWSALRSVSTRLPAWVQTAGAGLYLLVLSLAALGLLLPRPRGAGLPGRPWGFRLLALLVPGLGLIDEVWGIMLLLPWCALMLGVLGGVAGWRLEALPFWGSALSNTGLGVLVALYALNLVGLTLEELGHSKRVRRLKRAPPPASGTPGSPDTSPATAPHTPALEVPPTQAAVPLEPGVSLSKPRDP